MTDETLKQYILNYHPESDDRIQKAKIDNYNFTFLIENGKAIGGVLDMGAEPQIHVLEEYRGKGYGASLLRDYMVVNQLLESNNYVYYEAVTEDGEKLIKSFANKYKCLGYSVVDAGFGQYIIMKYSKIKTR